MMTNGEKIKADFARLRRSLPRLPTPKVEPIIYPVGSFVMVKGANEPRNQNSNAIDIDVGFIQIKEYNEENTSIQYYRSFSFYDWSETTQSKGQHLRSGLYYRTNAIIRSFETEDDAKEYALKIGSASGAIISMISILTTAREQIRNELHSQGHSIDNMLNIIDTMNAEASGPLMKGGALLKMFSGKS